MKSRVKSQQKIARVDAAIKILMISYTRLPAALYIYYTRPASYFNQLHQIHSSTQELLKTIFINIMPTSVFSVSCSCICYVPGHHVKGLTIRVDCIMFIFVIDRVFIALQMCYTLYGNYNVLCLIT